MILSYEENQQRRIREIRRQVIGMGILKCAANGEGSVHIHYCNENGLPPAAMQTPMMSPPTEKFTMSKEDFRTMMHEELRKQS